MKILKKGLVYRSTVGPCRYQAWPSICKDENEVLYTVWSGHRSSHVCPFGKNLMSVSNDSGESWSVPSIVNDTWLDDRDTGITYLGNGKMILSYFNHPAEVYRTKWRNWIVRDAEEHFRLMIGAYLDAYEQFTPEENRAGSFIRRSFDYGKTWEPAIKMPISTPHGPVKTNSGRLLYLGREFPGLASRYDNIFPEDGDTVKEEDKGRIFLYESFDDGATWQMISKLPLDSAAHHEYLHEPHIVELESGELIAAIRAHDDPKLHEFGIYLISSKDGGKSWGDVWKYGKTGSPPHLLLRKDGSVLMTYGRRYAPFGIRAAVSYDGCRTFGEEFILSDAPDADLGYPATVELSDGSLVTVYYQLFVDDTKTSIGFTKWKI